MKYGQKRNLRIRYLVNKYPCGSGHKYKQCHGK
ncbi:MAG: SEC-C domain-containing protein [Bacilli bacterium]|nr:SEC-C domain-containing protein [Bacilli bacterium]